jgi:hypothetical protein
MLSVLNAGSNGKGAGIGGRYGDQYTHSDHCGNITISGGNVTAIKGSDADYSIGIPCSVDFGDIVVGGVRYYDSSRDIFENDGLAKLQESPFIYPRP